jgi:hypothetical protein
MNPLRVAFLGGAAVLALSAGAAFAAGQTSTSVNTQSDGARTERRILTVRDGETVVDSDEVHEGHGGPGPGMMRHGEHGDPEHAAKHLREVLQLTPAQEPALQAFLASMHPPAPPPGHEAHRRFEIARGPDGKVDPAKVKEEAAKWRAEAEARRAEMEKKRAEEAALTTPQKLDRMVKHMAEESAKHQAELQAHVDSVKRFYAALTPSQQKAFDALHQGGMGGGMHEHGGPGREVRVMRFGEAGPMPPMPPLPPMAMNAPYPPMPPLPPEPPAPPPPPGGDR